MLGMSPTIGKIVTHVMLAGIVEKLTEFKPEAAK